VRNSLAPAGKGPAELGALLPELTAFAVMPYLGPEAVAEELAMASPGATR
jgi:hypothetical protein